MLNVRKLLLVTAGGVLAMAVLAAERLNVSESRVILTGTVTCMGEAPGPRISVR